MPYAALPTTLGIVGFYSVFYTGYSKATRKLAPEEMIALVSPSRRGIGAWNKLTGLASLTVLGTALASQLGLCAALPPASELANHGAVLLAIHGTLSVVGKYKLDPSKVLLYGLPPAQRLSLVLGYAASGVVLRAELLRGSSSLMGAPLTATVLLGLLHFLLMEGVTDPNGMKVRPAAHLATLAAAVPLLVVLARQLA